MSTIKVDVAWSPVREDLFLTCRSELNLYRTEDIQNEEVPKTQGMKISDNTYALLLSTNSEYQYIKCTAWYPRPEPSNLVAVGLANGRVVLTSFGKGSSQDPHRLCGKEFVPKHQRQCSYLAWNPVESNLLAEGLERYRADYSILIWDVYHQQRACFSDEPGSIQKTSVELGSSETTSSLAWFPQEPQSLVTGMSNKFLRIFDLRDTSHPQSAAYTKAVYGVKVDPLCQHRLASFHEAHISIWDTRNFEKPVSTIVDSKNVLKLAWSPTSSGLLASLAKDSSVVKLYDVQHSIIADEIEPASAAERRLCLPDDQIISSFDWHPTHKNRMLTVTESASVRDITIFERIAPCWSPEGHLSWVSGQQLWQIDVKKTCKDKVEDISSLMYNRAKEGYGIQERVEDNIKLIGNDQSLKDLWQWIQYMKDLQISSGSEDIPRSPRQNMVTRTSTPALHQGIKTLLCDTTLTVPSTDSLWSWQTVDGYKSVGQQKIYQSTERMKVLELCGWCYSRDTSSAPIIDKLESLGQFERAAAVAVFNMKLGRAIDVLHKGSKGIQNDANRINLSVVAMALSGFSEENTMWQGISSRLSTELQHPYLRVMFSVLTMDNDNWFNIVNDPQLEVCDRVAIACFYLPDSKLSEFIEQLQTDLLSKGDLSGILLTGFSQDCLDLFQTYIDYTGDIQTAAVSLIQCIPNSETSKDPRLRQWIDTYRDLLDTWRLWHQRAKFDVYRQKCGRTSHGIPWGQPQVFVSCNFCGKSVSFNSLATRSRTFMFGGTAAHKPRVTSCPSCRKPLPRCALCLINMGTSAGGGSKQPDAKDKDGDNRCLARFSDWFTWCQSCRHGGHAEHMAEWYKEHLECPVTGCSCKCASIDVIGNLATDPSSPSSS